MPKTYEPIATQTLGTASNSVTFSSIPQTYTDLVLIVHILSNSINDDLFARFNGDSATNYTVTFLRGNGTSVTSDDITGLSRARFSDNSSPTTTTANFSILHLQNYSDSTIYKIMLSRANNAGVGVDMHANLWRSTSAINAIEIFPASGNMAIGSTFTLYGIKAA